MDAVLARRETEEGTESDDLLRQQAETEKRQTDGRNAEESEDRREQAHGPSVSPERLSPPREPHPPRQNGGGPRPLSLLACYWRIPLPRGQQARTDRNLRPAKYFPGVALPGTRCRKGRFHSRSRLPSSACGRSSATCGRSEAASPVCSPWRSSMTNAPGGICKSRSDRSPKTSRSSRRRRTRFL